MNVEWRKYILLIIGFVVLVLLEYFKPKPVDWSLNFEYNEKIPYGCYALFHSLTDLFPDAEIEPNHVNYFQFLKNQSGPKTSLIIITDNFNADSYDTGAFLDFVRNGNQLFISSADYSQAFSDSCNFSITSMIADSLSLKSRKQQLNFVNPKLHSDRAFRFQGQLFRRKFTRLDSSKTTILGINAAQEPNFIKKLLGDGEIYIHLQPMTFTNYYVLYGSHEYSASALSYITGSTIVWDEYYKPGNAMSSSPIRYILNQQSLKYAYYMVMTLIVLYILIEARRKQRIIPVIKSPENTTLAFIKTIGLLYYQRGNHKDLAIKKITYFQDHIKTRYHINVSDPSAEIITKLVNRSGVDEKMIYDLFDFINKVTLKQTINEGELMALNKKIEHFHNKSI